MEKIEHYANIDSRMRKHSRSLGKDGLITNWGQLDMQINLESYLMLYIKNVSKLFKKVIWKTKS